MQEKKKLGTLKIETTGREKLYSTVQSDETVQAAYYFTDWDYVKCWSFAKECIGGWSELGNACLKNFTNYEWAWKQDASGELLWSLWGHTSPHKSVSSRNCTQASGREALHVCSVTPWPHWPFWSMVGGIPSGGRTCTRLWEQQTT